MVKGLPVLSSDVTRVLDRWCPDGWSERDLRALESIRGTVREWVVKAAPENPHVARRLLRTTAMLAVWAYRTWGTTDPSVVLDPRNVEHWVMSVNADRSPGWRENTRGALRAVGRAANPKAWPLPKPGMTQVTVATPYGSVDETAFVRTARLAGRFNRAGRLWVVGGSFGGGLYGRELTLARVDDFEEIADGRLVVRTRGPKARLVPIRRGYTTLVREALNHAHKGRFIKTTGRNSVYALSNSLDSGDGKGLSLRRARSTWLQAHLVAGTSLAAFRWLAGPISANTLEVLLPEAADLLDNETAVMEGLRA